MNPAGLAKQKESRVQATGYTAFETNFYSFAYSGVLESLQFGVGYVSAQTSGATRTGYSEDLEKYVGTGDTFGAAQHAAFGAVALSPIQNIYAGLTLKYIWESVDSGSATGYGADVGLLCDIPVLDVTVGATIQNVLAPQLTWGAADPRSYYKYYALGVSKAVLEGLKITADVHKKSGSAYTYHGGVELRLSPNMPLRAGYDDGDLAFGAGLELQGLTLSYAIVIPKSSENFLNQDSFFALEYKFD